MKAKQIYTSQFNEVSSQLPNEFTSSDFYKACRAYGVQEWVLQSGAATQFLNKNFFSISPTKKKWAKKEVPNNLFQELLTYDPIQQAIDVLKKAGYRILKPITEYKEL